jgi:hypothetical protein
MDGEDRELTLPEQLEALGREIQEHIEAAQEKTAKLYPLARAGGPDKIHIPARLEAALTIANAEVGVIALTLRKDRQARARWGWPWKLADEKPGSEAGQDDG